MAAGDPFVSYAQNGEDVVLWRALQGVGAGCYVDVGAMLPDTDSVTRAFYERGWRGLNIEPVPVYAASLAEARPDEDVLQVAIGSDSGGSITLHHVVDTGLSTASGELSATYRREDRTIEDLQVPVLSLDDAIAGSAVAGREIHFLKIDVEGAEADVLASIDLCKWRPWVLVVEAVEPQSTKQAHEEWEPRVLESGYQYCLFDGLNRFYVADEHAELKPALSAPANVLDEYITAALFTTVKRLHEVHEDLVERDTRLVALHERYARLEQELSQTWSELVLWRSTSLRNWAEAIAGPHREVDVLRAKLGAAETELASVTSELTDVRAALRAQHDRADQLAADTADAVAGSHREIDSLTAQIGAAEVELASVASELTDVRAALQAQRDRGDHLAASIRRLKATVSWRVTRPLRAVRKVQRRLSRRARA